MEEGWVSGGRSQWREDGVGGVVGGVVGGGGRGG